MRIHPDIQKVEREYDIDSLYREGASFIDKEAIIVDDFRGFYKDSIINNDQKAVDERKAEQDQRINSSSFEKDKHKKTIISEATFLKMVKEYGHLGPESTIIKTSKYDEFENKTGFVVEIPTKSKHTTSYLALSVDITFDYDNDEKFNEIRKEIESGNLAEIKYFKSKGFQGTLFRVPRVIFAVDFKTIKDINDLGGGIDEESKKELREHFIQFQFLEEALMQFRAFKKYALSIGKKEIASVYEGAESVIKEIYEERQRVIGDSGNRDSLRDLMKVKTDKFLLD
ncbi:hypothetical protein HY227_01065 [Candidatus Wolfebacteria bacterium]|nr:hypothetical protein [Candidatus Wolfebacteria bacterium]